MAKKCPTLPNTDDRVTFAGVPSSSAFSALAVVWAGSSPAAAAPPAVPVAAAPSAMAASRLTMAGPLGAACG